jgi:hypothetical protein
MGGVMRYEQDEYAKGYKAGLEKAVVIVENHICIPECALGCDVVLMDEIRKEIV